MSRAGSPGNSLELFLELPAHSDLMGLRSGQHFVITTQPTSLPCHYPSPSLTAGWNLLTFPFPSLFPFPFPVEINTLRNNHL